MQIKLMMEIILSGVDDHVARYNTTTHTYNVFVNSAIIGKLISTGDMDSLNTV